ncbi:hypothetical protein HPB48_011285 [Haemaphysalis longicornis]|uniref:Uncharacterized protein n=1 Tax=Haemaphysalis longicornis TaxID=44386 RepID=A0A9J6H0T9_HAELO|nr:hypothetical protein HPB48_011285 [Haemaphysalis longicornis]
MDGSRNPSHKSKRPAQGDEAASTGVAKTPRHTAPTDTTGAPTPGIIVKAVPLPGFLVPLLRLVRSGALKEFTTTEMLLSAFAMCSENPVVAVESVPKRGKTPACFRCTISCGSFVVVLASAEQEEQAEQDALRSVWVSLLLFSQSSAVDADPHPLGKRAPAGESSQSGVTEKETSGQIHPVFSAADVGLVVVMNDLTGDPDPDPAEVLKRTARLHGFREKYAQESCPGGFICSYILEERVVMLAAGAAMSAAKNRAATAALKYLSSVVPTLKVKKLLDKYSADVTKAQVEAVTLSEGTSDDQSETSTSTECPTTNFSEKIEHIVKDYKSNGLLKDLVFSPDFDAEERDFISSLANKYKLVCAPFRESSGTTLVLRHKLSVQTIVDTLKITGPTDRFELVNPEQAPRAE